MVSSALLAFSAAAEAFPYTHQNFPDDPEEFTFAVLPDSFGPADTVYRDGYAQAIRALNLLRPEFVMSVGTAVPAAYDVRRAPMTVLHEGAADYSFVHSNRLFIALGSAAAPLEASRYAWFRSQLEAHPGVAWTYVFMHNPSIWTEDPAWLAFEESDLVGRNYTVFAGGWHQYLHVKRHGHDYYVLSTAGGAGALAGNDEGRRAELLGPAYGELDHVMVVKATATGPVIANIEVNGVLPHDFVCQTNTLSFAAEQIDMQLDEPVDPDTRSRLLLLRNRTDLDELYAVAREADRPPAKCHFGSTGLVDRAASPEDFTFAILPDFFGANSNNQPYRDGIARAIRAVNLLRPDLVMSVGDLIPAGWQSEGSVRSQHETIDAQLAGIIPPFYYVVGNHDICDSSAAYPDARAISASVWKERHGSSPYYSFVYRNCLFIAVDSMGDETGAGISATQYAWIRSELEAHPDVRWTFLFMHLPSQWLKSEWQALEASHLIGRRYTVFAGDWHQYLHVKRHGSDYYALAVAGGAGGVAASDYSRRPYLLGPEFGEIDHVAMVTVTAEGPVIANVELNHVYAHDFVAQTNTLSIAAENLAHSLDYPVDPGVATRFQSLAAGTDLDGIYDLKAQQNERNDAMTAKVMAMIAATAVSSAVSAGTIYVDDDNYGKTGMDGSCQELAYGTLQAAVDAAGDGDTILVYPGDYSAVGGFAAGGNAVVTFGNDGAKKLTMKSIEGAAVTRIIGASDPDDPGANGSGVGPKAVRPVVVVNTSSSKPVIIEGFTLTGGNVMTQTSRYDNFGSAVYAENRYAYFVDCDITGNRGSRGTMYYGTFVRCFIHDNDLYNGKGSCGFMSRLLNCIAVRNTDGAGLTMGLAVNCTFMDFGSVGRVNPGATGSEQSCFVNCLCQRGLINDNSLVFSNSVIRSTGNLKYNSDISDGFVILDPNEDPECDRQCVAPLFDDYRLLWGKTSTWLGEPEYITMIELPDEIDGYLDFHGNEIPRDSAICVGAVQEVVDPEDFEGGFVSFSEPTTPVGTPRSFVGGTYAYVKTYPEQWHVNTWPAKGRHLLWFDIAGVDGGRRPAEMDGSFWLMPPPKYTELAVNARIASRAYWVNPETGSDTPVGEETRGSEEYPFRTLAGAIAGARAIHDSNPAAIYAAPGIYDAGGTANYGVTNRFALTRPFLIKGAGAGQSIIVGGSDPGDTDTAGYGRGPAAVRCANLDDGVLQGFTLTGGRSQFGADSSATRGGGVFIGGASNPSLVSDCIITNCYAVRGSAVANGNVYRTRIYDCSVGQVRWAKLHSCLIDRRGGPSVEEEMGGSCVAYQCTLIGNSTKGPFSDNKVPAYNSVVYGGVNFTTWFSGELHGSVAYGFTGSRSSGDYVYQDPLFIDRENYDYRVPANSPAMTCGQFPDDYWTHYSSDIDSRPIVFSDGKPLAGAFQNPVNAVVPVAAGVKGTLSPAAPTVVEPGESVTVTAVDGTRHAVSLLVNGEPVEGTSWTFTAPLEGYPSAAVSVEAVFSTNWYVNADSAVGSDGSTGFTPETAKLTLAGVMGVALEAGDVVHAAPGIYDQGSMAQAYASGASGARTTPVRVCVGPGITLVGDEGAERTFIKGEAQAAGTELFGGGTPTRCLNLADGARVTGFTITGGSTPYTGSSNETEPYLGGGIIAPKLQTNVRPLVENCIISNNYACRGGGTYGGYFRNCRFFENYSTEDGNATFHSRMENCLIARNHGKSDGACVVRYPHGMFNVTMTSDNITDSTGNPTKYFVYNYLLVGTSGQGWGIANSIIMGGSETYTMLGATNCIFNTDAMMGYGKEDDWCNCRKLSEAEIMLDTDGRPLPGSPALDTGFNDLVVPGPALGGVQRIYNGRVDIGCYEKDMRAEFAAAIGGGVTVEAASPEVTLEGDRVRLTDGATIAGVWPAAGAQAKLTVGATAEGEGTLTGEFANEAAGVAETVSFANEAGTRRLSPGNVDLDYLFGFDGAGYGELYGFGKFCPSFLLLVK